MDLTVTTTPDELGKKLKVLRKARGLTQELVAQRMKLSVKTLSDLENGHRFTTRQMEDYAAVLDIKISLSIEMKQSDLVRLMAEEEKQQKKRAKAFK